MTNVEAAFLGVAQLTGSSERLAKKGRITAKHQNNAERDVPMVGPARWWRSVPVKVEGIVCEGVRAVQRW